MSLEKKFNKLDEKLETSEKQLKDSIKEAKKDTTNVSNRLRSLQGKYNRIIPKYGLRLGAHKELIRQNRYDLSNYKLKYDHDINEFRKEIRQKLNNV